MDQIPERYTAVLLNRIHEYEDVYTFIFEKPIDLTFEAGSYAHVLIPTVFAPERSVREISFASPPSDDTIAFSIITTSKSPWQIKLLELKNGDAVTLFKIKSHLTVPTQGILVMIANGIGITPFRSIIKEHYKKDISCILVHVGRNNYLYKNELTELPLTQYRIAREEIEATINLIIKQHIDAKYMIAGSPLFVENIASSLKENGISEENIQLDSFKGLID